MAGSNIPLEFVGIQCLHHRLMSVVAFEMALVKSSTAVIEPNLRQNGRHNIPLIRLAIGTGQAIYRSFVPLMNLEP